MRTCSEPDLRAAVEDLNGNEKDDNFKTALAERFSLDNLVSANSQQSSLNDSCDDQGGHDICDNSPRTAGKDLVLFTYSFLG